MSAEEREPVLGASRRRLLAAALVAPALAAAKASRATPFVPVPRQHDASEWGALLARYEGCSAQATAAGRVSDIAERAFIELRSRAQERADAELAPAEIVLTVPERVLEADGQRIVLAAYQRPAQSRMQLLALGHEHPDQRFRIEAWDAWQARRQAHLEALDVQEAHRRFHVLDRRWTRAAHREDEAVYSILTFPTVDPAALRLKFELAARHHCDNPHKEVLEGCCAALGIDLPKQASSWEV